jgi:hypothetical protein
LSLISKVSEVKGGCCLAADVGALGGRLLHLGDGSGTTGGAVGGLLGLLVLLGGLGLGDGGGAGGGADLGLGGTLGEDRGEVGTDNTTLGELVQKFMVCYCRRFCDFASTHLNLDVLAAALLGDLLSDALLVHAAVDLGPGDLAGVLALEEERLGLGAGEAEGLDVSGCSYLVVVRCGFRAAGNC